LTWIVLQLRSALDRAAFGAAFGAAGKGPLCEMKRRLEMRKVAADIGVTVAVRGAL
jgi:hypothetical protein